MSLGGAVLREPDLEAGIEQTDGEHQPGLSAADDGDVTHIASAVSAPAARSVAGARISRIARNEKAREFPGRQGSSSSWPR